MRRVWPLPATGSTRWQSRAVVGQECEVIVAVGRPADVIGSIANDRRTQLIVMGLSSDQGPFAPRPGSIAYRVLSSTTMPVLVVPASQN